MEVAFWEAAPYIPGLPLGTCLSPIACCLTWPWLAGGKETCLCGDGAAHSSFVDPHHHQQQTTRRPWTRSSRPSSR